VHREAMQRWGLGSARRDAADALPAPEGRIVWVCERYGTAETRELAVRDAEE
jgi:hypothetical protein